MEEIKSYLESGVLELYVVGDLSDHERHDVETMAAKYPEVRDELTAIETALESYASMYAIEPGADIRNKVLAGINGAENPVRQEAAIISMAPVKSSPFYKYAFAASVALLLLSWGALFSVYNQLNDSQLQVATLRSEKEKLAKVANFRKDQLASNKNTIAVLRNPDFKLVKLTGTKASPSSSIMVAFNPKKKEVMLDLSSLNMPVNDIDHQYQLWALVDGKPVDLGLFDMKDPADGMIKMKDLAGGQAFAVTLEPRGGSINPTMDQLMVMGAI